MPTRGHRSSPAAASRWRIARRPGVSSASSRTRKPHLAQDGPFQGTRANLVKVGAGRPSAAARLAAWSSSLRPTPRRALRGWTLTCSTCRQPSTRSAIKKATSSPAWSAAQSRPASWRSSRTGKGHQRWPAISGMPMPPNICPAARSMACRIGSSVPRAARIRTRSLSLQSGCGITGAVAQCMRGKRPGRRGAGGRAVGFVGCPLMRADGPVLRGRRPAASPIAKRTDRRVGVRSC